MQRNDKLGYYKGISSAISNLKKEFVTPQKFSLLVDGYEASMTEKERQVGRQRVQKMRDLHTFYTTYLELMQEQNLIDFDDMIFKVTDAFSKNQELVQFFQEQYLYTLVDEFQDTNAAQLEVIKSVASFEGLEANVFAVGDDDQTIFRFQGASSDNFEKYLDIFPNTEIIVLHNNYRSGQEVIDSASNVIQNNPARVSEFDYFKERGLNKQFTSGLDRSSVVEVHEFEHSFHEDYWIGQEIEKLRESGVKLSEIAIIARLNKQVVNITKFLDRFSIPYQIKRSESILDNRHINNLIQLIDVVSDLSKLKDDRIMWQVLSLDLLGLNQFDIFSLTHDAKEFVDENGKKGLSVYDYILKTHLPKYSVILAFMNKLIELNRYMGNSTFQNFFAKVVQDLSFIQYLELQPESFAELNRLSSLFQFVQARSRFNKNYDAVTFLTEINTMRERFISLQADPIDAAAENKVNIITAHSSKGLEYDHVFVYQCIENKWEKMRGAVDSVPLPPLNFDIDDPKLRKEIEKEADEIDERRLFYVAMTRAKRNLYLTLSKKYYDSDSGDVDVAEKMKSKFVVEASIANTVSHADLVSKHDEITRIILSPDAPIEIPEKNKEYLRNLVNNNLRLSASKLNIYTHCHYRFLLQEVYRLPVLVDGFNLEVGTAVHKAVEMLTKSYNPATGEHYDLEKILTIAHETFTKEIGKKADLEEMKGSVEVAIEDMRRGVAAYYTYFLTSPHKPEQTEFNTYGLFDGIKLTGRIDKVSKNGEESLVITDYKTSSRFPTITEFLGLTKNSDKNYLRQLLFYRLLVENSEDLKTKKISGKLASIKLEYINTKDGEVKCYELPKAGMYEYYPRSNSKKTADFDIDAEYELLKVELKQTFESIKSLEFNRTSDHSECEYCPFKRHCNR
jgi:DNA helicase-2/ATP-dependent DNA helicase PcrA